MQLNLVSMSVVNIMTLREDLKAFKKECEEIGALCDNYSEDIFKEYHKDKETRSKFILDITYKEWLIYKGLTTPSDVDEFFTNKYMYEHYIIFED